MAEYIDKEDAVGVIADWAEDTRVRVDSDHGQIYQRCIRLIRDLPSANVIERKHGKWEYQTMVHESGMKASGVKCSICGATYNLSITLPDMMVEALNFCPNCGADMRGEE